MSSSTSFEGYLLPSFLRMAPGKRKVRAIGIWYTATVVVGSSLRALDVVRHGLRLEWVILRLRTRDAQRWRF